MPQSEEYYTALKLQNKEAVLVRFPEASHGITNRPREHLSKMPHIISCSDQHKRIKK